MSKVAVVYWSGTGNTEAMAQAVVEGAKGKGAEVSLFTPSEFDASKASTWDGIAFGCPAMGSEVLEEYEFEPMFSECKAQIKKCKVALFGSYGWGDGEWMRSWEEDCMSEGIHMVHDSVICCGAPDESGAKECKELGEALA